MMPNWSAEGLRLTSSRSSPQYGVWIIDLAGEDHKYVCPGWGAQWSPDGKRIVFTEGSVIKAYNVESEATTTLLAAGGENPYRQIYWNIGWSPDSKRLCFKGTTLQGVNEVATINATADKPDLKVRYSTNQVLNADFSWHPNGRRVVFSAHSSERKKTQLFEFDPDKADAPVLYKGQDQKRNNTDHCWTPDGKLLVIVSGDY
jgi:Tol biopolymer transport system component